MPKYPDIDIQVKLDIITGNHETDRNALRRQLLDWLIQEKAGTGNQELTSKYRYNVENISRGGYIYLTRPVPLNKGFDFVIHAENCIFSNNKDNPKHEDIINDLEIKKSSNFEQFHFIVDLINKVFLCYDPSDLLLNVNFENNNNGLSVEILLKLIKWLFIEQDIRYWNWSGRNMFYKAIQEACQ